MSEGKKSSQFKSKRGKHKRNEVMFYVNYTVVFLLIALAVAIPVICVGMNSTVKAVHAMQEQMPKDYYDVQLDDTYNQATFKDSAELVNFGKLVGNLKCDSVGIDTKVYYGINRVSLRDGVGLSANWALPGNDACAYVRGYASSAFGSLYNVKKGASITLETFYGKFEYKVVAVKKSKDASKFAPKGEAIILSTASSTDAFSAQNGEGYCVVATLTSKEVQ